MWRRIYDVKREVKIVSGCLLNKNCLFSFCFFVFLDFRDDLHYDSLLRDPEQPGSVLAAAPVSPGVTPPTDCAPHHYNKKQKKTFFFYF